MKVETDFFLYCRKSTDEVDRQIQSIESQRNVLLELAEKQQLKIVDTFDERKSAKAPGRAQFNDMIKRIEHGEAAGILCWKLDRLARNPVDGGRIQWLLQQGIIKSIKTPEREYLSKDNALIASVEFGMSNQYVRDLSDNVKRGLVDKVKRGWKPGRAPLGYLNSKSHQKGQETISLDPEKSKIVRELFCLFLTGNYSVPQIHKIAREKLFLTKIALGSLYKLFQNPFYYGFFNWPGHGLVQGSHPPLITTEEFDRIQRLLGRKGNPRPRTKKFALTGLMRCMECGSAITAEEKYKQQKNGNTHHYIYYRCTKKKSLAGKFTDEIIDKAVEGRKAEGYRKFVCKPNVDEDSKRIVRTMIHMGGKDSFQKSLKCQAGAIKVEELYRQIDEFLSNISVPEEKKEKALIYLKKIRHQNLKLADTAIEHKKKQLDRVNEQLNALVSKFAAPENSDGRLINQEEYLVLKTSLQRQKAALDTSFSNNRRTGADLALDRAEQAFNFSCYARILFKNGDDETKRAIFSALGSNLYILDKKVLIELHEPFELIKNRLPDVIDKSDAFEPENFFAILEGFDDFVREFPTMCGIGESNSY